MLWDLFCQVVDNHGDAGVCWRLAADLASRGERVRLWIDDASALAWMAPQGADGVEVGNWDEATRADPGEVVIEAFGCTLPPPFVDRMAGPRPLWINLEYLSAEAYVERSHRLPSPRPHGQQAWFFYPGFTPATGGLLREPGLLARRAAWRRDEGLAALGASRRDGERVVSLFCYPHAPVEALAGALCDMPTLLLATAGHAARLTRDALGPAMQRGRLRAVELPLLTQPGFDQLLWSSDLNFVRGEDSLVRAFWAGAPCIWHIYPQHDGAHAAKLDALLDRISTGMASDDAQALRRLWMRWNGLADGPVVWPPDAPWQAASLRWRAALAAQADLATQLIGFCREKR